MLGVRLSEGFEQGLGPGDFFFADRGVVGESDPFEFAVQSGVWRLVCGVEFQEVLKELDRFEFGGICVGGLRVPGQEVYKGSEGR